jgi:hypothetical protein
MKYWLLALLGIMAAALFGCGGGGGGSSTSSNGATIFVTDDLNAGYDHVWVTIKSITLGRVDGGTETVFSHDGKPLDLRSLMDANGKRFEFIMQTGELNGTYNSVTVVLDDEVVLYPTGSSTGLVRTFEGSVNGEKVLTTTFAERTFTSGDDNLIIDFDLSQWNDNGSQVTGAVIVVLSGEVGLTDPSRHDHRSYPGTISGLSGTAPNQTFFLTRGNHTVSVRLDGSTEISRSGNGDNGNAVLQNGMHVVVRGRFDPALNALVAGRVKITGNDEDEDDEDEAVGTVSNISDDLGEFDLDVFDADGFIPVSNPIRVKTTLNTSFRSRSGGMITKSDFFAQIENGDVVEVEGVYDAGTNMLTAVKVKFEDDDDDDNDDDEDNAKVTGATSNVNLVAGTFTIAATSFTGINVAPGTQVTVATNAETVFRPLNGGGENLTQAEFFALLTANPGQLVEVEGNWDGSVLTAFKAKLED